MDLEIHVSYRRNFDKILGKAGKEKLIFFALGFLLFVALILVQQFKGTQLVRGCYRLEAANFSYICKN